MTSILLVGLNHRTAALDVRERFALHNCGLPQMHEGLAAQVSRAGQPGLSAAEGVLREVVVLSTCNRLEVYAVADNAAAGWDVVEHYLAGLYGASGPELHNLLYLRRDAEAVRHLLCVAAGLDSLILGEPQILGQVSEAIAGARAAHTAGPLLSHLFSQALHCGKRARTETAIGSHTISLSHTAALLAARQLHGLAGRHALVIGAGEMAELAALALQQHGAAAITCVNRTQARAEAIATKVNGRALAWPELQTGLLDADVVVSATSAPHPILLLNDIAEAQARRQRPLLLIDIALPRDIAPEVDALPGVIRFDIDTLRDTIDANLAKRQAAVPAVEAIVDAEAEAYLGWCSEREVVPALVELRRRAEAVAHAELERTLRRLGNRPGHDAGVEQEVAILAHRIVAKLLHEPTVRLKAQAASGNGETYTQIVEELFALSNGHVHGDASTNGDGVYGPPRAPAVRRPRGSRRTAPQNGTQAHG